MSDLERQHSERMKEQERQMNKERDDRLEAERQLKRVRYSRVACCLL